MSNFQGVKGGVGYTDQASDEDSRRRQQLAQLMLQQSNATPAVGWTGALNKMLAGALAGYQIGKDGEEQSARRNAKNDTMAAALRAGQTIPAESKAYEDGTTINWDERKGDPNQVVSILSSNPDTAGAGLQMQMGQAEAKAKAEAERANLDYQAKLTRETRDSTPIKMEDGTYVIPNQVPGYGAPGTGGQPTHPAAVSASAATPAAPTTSKPPAAPGVDMGTSPNAPTPPPVQVAGDATANPTTGGELVRGNNYGNIRTNAGNAWDGKTTKEGDQFETFDTPVNGLRAVGKTLQTYAANGARTLNDIIRRWAPPNENDTAGLVLRAQESTGILANEPLDLKDPVTLGKVIRAIVTQEHGPKAVDDNLIMAGVDAALGNTKIADASDGSVRSDVSSAYDRVVPQEAPTTTPAAPGSVRADLEAAGGSYRWEGGRLVGGQSKPKVRTLTDEEVQQRGYQPGTKLQEDRDGRVTVVQAPQKAGEGSSKGEREWRQDFQKPIAQAREITSQVNLIRNATKAANGTGDIAAIVAFNKLLDPGAVVREADVSLTLQAQGVGDRLATWMANKKEGDILPPDLRAKMVELADTIYNTSNSYLRDSVMPYQDAIKADGLSFDKILPPQMRKSLGWDDQPAPQQPPAGQPPQTAPTGTAQAAPKALPPGAPPIPPGFELVR